MSAILQRVEVDVWQIDLGLDPARLRRLSDYLDDAERSRAARFHFREDRERFVMARGGLRSLLAGYLGQTPQSIRFSYGPQGKPELAVDNSEPRLCFNLSHSHELGVCAVARGRQLGIDVERIRPQGLDSLNLAQQFFTRQETAMIQAASPAARAETFFRLWTRKEAYLKGHGKGLSLPLNDFEVSLEDSTVRCVEHGGKEATDWSVREFRPGPGYVGAVASEGEEWEVHLRQFESWPRECAIGAKPPIG